LLAWVAYCDCPRHHGVRRLLTGSDGPDDADARAVDVLMRLAAANSLFTERHRPTVEQPPTKMSESSDDASLTASSPLRSRVWQSSGTPIAQPTSHGG
jgi:hypothetical protein